MSATQVLGCLFIYVLFSDPLSSGAGPESSEAVIYFLFLQNLTVSSSLPMHSLEFSIRIVHLSLKKFDFEVLGAFHKLRLHFFKFFDHVRP